jgi:hypothetical protein
MHKQKAQQAYYIATHPNAHRAGEPARIVGVVMVSWLNHPPIACFHVRYPDGDRDFPPISDGSNYEIISTKQLRQRKKSVTAIKGRHKKRQILVQALMFAKAPS